jgi:hypothetical protein
MHKQADHILVGLFCFFSYSLLTARTSTSTAARDHGQL